MFKILCYKILDAGRLKGFVDVEIPKWGDFQILGIKIFENEKGKWVSMPSYKSEDVNKKNNKPIYYPYVKFKDKDVSKIFEDKLLTSLDEWLKSNEPQYINGPKVNKINSESNPFPSGDVPF